MWQKCPPLWFMNLNLIILHPEGSEGRMGEHVADTTAAMIHEPEFDHIAPRRKQDANS
jgi:hypothetical protein